MIKRTSASLAICLLLIISYIPQLTSFAQDDSRLYVPQTGHWITNDFLATYQSVADPQAIFGYPITDPFINQTTGYVYQYFQRALFELHPENPAALRVEIKRLGDYLYPSQKGQTLPVEVNPSACEYFPDTGHQVCYSFRDFFNANGGIAQFGYPISDLEYHEGRIVQWFQRASFVWHPELAPGSRVVLADLGQRYFDIRHEDPIRLRPNFIIRTILNLQVRAFPETAVMAPEGNQSIFIILQDQNLLPVSDATIILTVKYPSGKEVSYLADPTDSYGITKVQFHVDEKVKGTVEVSVKASFDSLDQDTRTSFRIWY